MEDICLDVSGVATCVESGLTSISTLLTCYIYIYIYSNHAQWMHNGCTMHTELRDM